MFTIKRKQLVALAMISLVFIFGTANAGTSKDKADITVSPIVDVPKDSTLAKGQNHLPALAKGQNHLPKTKASQENSCS